MLLLCTGGDIMNSNKNQIRTTVMLDPSIVSKLDVEAAVIGLSRSTYLNLILGAYLNMPNYRDMFEALTNFGFPHSDDEID